MRDSPMVVLELLDGGNGGVEIKVDNSHPDLLVTHQRHPLFQITPVLNTGLTLSEPLQLYKGHKAI